MYLFIDTETGGTSTEYSLLTATAILTDEYFDIIPIGRNCRGITLHIKSEIYTVSAKALSVNKIDLVQHDQISISAQQAREDLLQFLNEARSKTGRRAFVVAGHSVDFDRRFLLAHLMSQTDWDEYMTYPTLDTAVMARYLAAIGLHDHGFSLSRLVHKYCPKYYTGEMHDSCNDVLATIELARALVNMIKDKCNQPR